MRAVEPVNPPVRLLPVQVSMHKMIAVLHAGCFDDSWNAYTVGQVMRMPGAFGYVAVISDAESGEADLPVGFALASGAHDERELLSIGVLPDHRRCGIARELVQMVIDESIRPGSRLIPIETAKEETP